jgi:ATP-dependent DNA helicase RecQ
MSLIEKGIKADYLGSSQTNPGVTKDAKNGKISLLYMTPEKALSLNQRSLFFLSLNLLYIFVSPLLC